MPVIGLLSDSHGRAAITRRAVKLLADQGAEKLLHLGDVGSTAVIDTLVLDGQTTGRASESRLVFGNTDFDLDQMGRYATMLGIGVDHPVGTLDCGGQCIAFTHGDDESVMRSMVRQQVAYLCHGHSHEKRDERIGQTRVINPGALFRAAQHTVATLDTATDKVTFFGVDGS